MNKSFLYLIISILFLSSCSSRKQISYFGNLEKYNNSNWNKIKMHSLNFISKGDILKIDISSSDANAAVPYNKISLQNNIPQNLQLLQIEGYLVDNYGHINLPIIGKVKADSLTLGLLQKKLENILIEDKHLIDPIVKINRVNSKFTVLGEVRNPGTYHYYDENLNILQALGYAGDLTIDSKRDDAILIRNFKGKKITKKINFNDAKLLSSNDFYILNNDVIIINPSFSKVKSAGFIGNPSSIASIASIILSISLIIINK